MTIDVLSITTLGVRGGGTGQADPAAARPIISKLKDVCMSAQKCLPGSTLFVEPTCYTLRCLTNQNLLLLPLNLHITFLSHRIVCVYGWLVLLCLVYIFYSCVVVD